MHSVFEKLYSRQVSFDCFTQLLNITELVKNNTPKMTESTTRIGGHIDQNLQNNKFKIDSAPESTISSHKGPQKYSLLSSAAFKSSCRTKSKAAECSTLG